MKILSLFDGMSVAQQALTNLGIDIERYYASEIDPYAIAVTQSNFPNTIHVGDVQYINKYSEKATIQYNYKNLDLIIGGSPCTDLSIAKKNRQGLKGEQSKLFYEFVRLVKELKPHYFILENVASMAKDQKVLMEKELFGIESVTINASLVSAQNRKRIFIVGRLVKDTYVKVEIPQPEDRGILLKDILQDKENTIIKNSWKYAEGKPREYTGKCPTLSANMGTAGGHVPLTKKDNRKLTPMDMYYRINSSVFHIVSCINK